MLHKPFGIRSKGNRRLSIDGFTKVLNSDPAAYFRTRRRVISSISNPDSPLPKPTIVNGNPSWDSIEVDDYILGIYQQLTPSSINHLPAKETKARAKADRKNVKNGQKKLAEKYREQLAKEA